MQECDMVMKGGLTSGVVYPHVVKELSEHYRFKQIGGASAGAIAAVFAAAAEFQRQAPLLESEEPKEEEGGQEPPIGFDGVAELAKYLAHDMRTLFQPDPSFKRLFDILIAVVSETDSVLVATMRALIWPLAILASAFALGWWLFNNSGDLWEWIGIVLIAFFISFGIILASLSRVAFHHFPNADFGLCSGKTQDYAPKNKPAVGDWIRSNVDRIAGLGSNPDIPLTVGDLEARGVTLATMTTDLSTGRPYQLPFETSIHYFSKREFDRLFDSKFVKFLCETGGKHIADNTVMPTDDLYKLPVGRDFPVALAARMSLSFPGLIAAVPLYRYDDQLGDREARFMRRCLFSDGGISSNFPIHFFDAPMPRRPTFGITLGVWEEGRHSDADRVTMETHALQSTDLAVREISSPGGFAMSILNTAKDWQDTIQSMMPGYADRIVTIRLDPTKEGGMKLAMSKDTIEMLSDLGKRAGKQLVKAYSYTIDAKGFDQHRYARALSLLPKLELVLEEFANALDQPPMGVPDGLTAAQAMTEHDPAAYDVGSNSWRRDPFLAFARALEGVARGGQSEVQVPRRKRIQGREGKGLPVHDGRVRLIAESHRVPEHRR